jgi:hypothetical protein
VNAEAGTAASSTVETRSAVRAPFSQTRAFRTEASMAGGVHQRQAAGRRSVW